MRGVLVVDRFMERRVVVVAVEFSRALAAAPAARAAREILIRRVVIRAPARRVRRLSADPEARAVRGRVEDPGRAIMALRVARRAVAVVVVGLGMRRVGRAAMARGERCGCIAGDLRSAIMRAGQCQF
jgi:hypothetical protein